MERIYNKLNRLTIAEFRIILNNLNVSHERCKTKNDYIRAFLKKKAKSAKLTPKKMMKNRNRSDISDTVSVCSHFSKCIIEDIKETDMSKVDKYLEKHKRSK